MKGLEPSTFCMASRRSSQLSYSRVSSYSTKPTPLGLPKYARRGGERLYAVDSATLFWVMPAVLALPAGS